MSEQEKQRINDEIFFKNLSKYIKKFAKRNGYEVPDFNGVITDKGAIFMNVAAYSGKAKEHYQAMYLDHAHEIGMEISWLGTEVSSMDKKRKYTLTGLDPDGGKNCIRLIDDNGNESHISPAGFTYLMSNAGM